jgi:hypothetical protein
VKAWVFVLLLLTVGGCSSTRPPPWPVREPPLRWDSAEDHRVP